MTTPPLKHDAEPRTSPTLIGRLHAWDDRTAWNLFIERYSPLLDRWSRSKLQNAADVDEVNQTVLWELARRFVSFQYDPTRSFRGWLRTLHTSRLLDFLKSERRRAVRELEVNQLRQSPAKIPQCAVDGTLTSDKLQEEQRQARLILSATIQQRVRERVSEKTWTIFWEIAVEGQLVADTARRHSMRYASAFAAFSRVRKMLRQEASGEPG